MPLAKSHGQYGPTLQIAPFSYMSWHMKSAAHLVTKAVHSLPSVHIYAPASELFGYLLNTVACMCCIVQQLQHASDPVTWPLLGLQVLGNLSNTEQDCTGSSALPHQG